MTLIVPWRKGDLVSWGDDIIHEEITGSASQSPISDAEPTLGSFRMRTGCSSSVQIGTRHDPRSEKNSDVQASGSRLSVTAPAHTNYACLT